MIRLSEGAEYPILIADIIATLLTRENNEEVKDQLFTLKLWTHNRELPFVFENHCDFEFMQEGIRIEDHKAVMYIFYDEIEYVRIDKQ